MLDLKKNDEVLLDLEKDNINKINIGLGWDTRADLDVHAVLRDANGKAIDRIYYGNLYNYGVRLSGDNLTGAGAGDDEIIYIDRSTLDKRIKTISIYVNIYSGISNFGKVQGGYIRIFDKKNELAKAKLDIKEIKNAKAIHFAELFIDENITFKIIMDGSISNLHNLLDSYTCRNYFNTDVEEEIAIPKRKKIFGIF